LSGLGFRPAPSSTSARSAASRSEAVAINNRRQVIGKSDTPLNDSYGDPIQHPFVWQNGQMIDLGTLSGGEARVVGINDHGQIIGSSVTKAGRTHVVPLAQR